MLIEKMIAEDEVLDPEVYEYFKIRSWTSDEGMPEGSKLKSLYEYLALFGCPIGTIIKAHDHVFGIQHADEMYAFSREYLYKEDR